MYIVLSLLLWLLSYFIGSNSKTVTVSNIKNLITTDGNIVVTGEVDILAYGTNYYVYFNNWGCCLDNTCKSPCVYADNHTVLLYVTPDFVDWEYKGAVLPPSSRQPGIVFRPHVVYNPNTKTFVMWYEDRPNTSTRNYAVAVGPTPSGPFVTTVRTASFKCGNGGDFDLFVDEDGVGYLIVTHYSYFCIEKLDEALVNGTGEMTTITSPAPAEGPVMFKRDSVYYVLFGVSCCACTGGSNILVHTSSTPLGKYTLLGDIGTAPDGTYVTRAQQSTIAEVRGDSESLQYIWVGNAWGTSPDKCYNHDFVSWFPLTFKNQTIQQLTWQDTVSFSVKSN